MILVTGATGHVGREVVRQLASESVAVRAVSRSPSTANLPDGVEVVGADLAEPQSLRPYLDGVNAVFLVWPFVTTGSAAALLDQLPGRIVYLSSEGVPDDPAEAADGITSMHATIERLIAGRDMAWTFLRPTGFATNTLDWAAQIRAGDTVRAPFATLARPLIHERDIAAVAVRALVDAGHVGQIHYLSGPALVTQAEQARAIGEALGRPIRFEDQPIAEARAAMVTAWGDANIVDHILAAWSDMNDHPEPVTDTVEKLTGVPAHTFRRWAFDHAPDFRR
jgi:uncharacterized protein YbjT (DUF2867 family)